MLTLTETFLLKSFQKLVTLNKPHKYIRRWLKNGEWQYEYPNDAGNSESGRQFSYKEPSFKLPTGKFGVFLRQFRGKPSEAFRELFRRKSGQAVNVVSLELPVVRWDNSDGANGKYVEESAAVPTGIDLVYGNDGRGIKHILRNHFLYKNDFNSVEECEQALSDLLLGLQNGTRKIIQRQFKSVKNGSSAEGIERIGKWELLDDRGCKLIIDVEVQQHDNERYYRHFVLTSYDNTRRKEEKLNSDEERVQRLGKMNQRTY